MKIVILGAGVIGVTSAWYLSRQGHEVTVIDRQAAPALETSFANAGEVSPGYSAPWAAPGIPLKAMKWMFMRHAPLDQRGKTGRHRKPRRVEQQRLSFGAQGVGHQQLGIEPRRIGHARQPLGRIAQRLFHITHASFRSSRTNGALPPQSPSPASRCA